MSAPDLAAARATLSGLRVGDPVVYIADGREHAVTVQRASHRDPGPDGQQFGHPDHACVTIGYGPGRWNRDVSAKGWVDGWFDLRLTNGVTP